MFASKVWRGLGAAAVVVAVLLSLLVLALPVQAQRAPDPPAEAPPAGERNERLGRDPFGAMGGDSPFCKRAGLAASERRNCRGSGALSHPVRIDHYGFDVHIDTGIDNVTGNLAKGLQDIAQMGWMTLLYLVKGVTLLLEWAFSLDLLGESMKAIDRALNRLHRHVFGETWFLAAMSAAGLWGIYRGLVQRRTSETFAGLFATVALMVLALAIVDNPSDTVGRASKIANDGALGIVSGATTGSVSGSPHGFGEAMSRVFDQVVLRPWCALEFSDVAFCLASPRKAIAAADMPDDPEIRLAHARAPSVAEMFLAFEPNGEGGAGQRNQIYEEWKDDRGSRLQAVTRIQREPSTGPRLALLTFVAIGMLGAILLLAWIGVRLVGYGLVALILILFAPVALFAPAFGDSGRATFVAWIKRLLGALVAKAVYAVLLAVVLVAAAALAELDSLGWIAVWLLQTVFWWVLLLKRNQIIDLASVPGVATGGSQRGSLLQRLHYARHNAHAASAVLGAGADLARGQTIDRLRQRGATNREAVASAAERALRSQARPELERQHQDAQTVLARDREATDQLRRLDGLLRPYDERAEIAKANGKPAPDPTQGQAPLLRRREELQAARPDPATLGSARELLRHADSNRARSGQPVTEQDERAYLAQRRDEIDRLPTDHERNLRAAGIDPRHYEQATGREREQMRQQVGRALDHERARLAATGDAQSRAPSRREIRRATAALDSAELRSARKETFQKRRQERRQARRQTYPRTGRTR